MNCTPPVSPRVFQALQSLNVSELQKFSEDEIRPILPCLVRMSLISPLDLNNKCSENRKSILTLLAGIDVVNSLVALLSIEFHALEVEVKKEQQLRHKIGSGHSDGLLVQSMPNGIAIEFERSPTMERMKLVLSEIFLINAQIQEHARGIQAAQSSGQISGPPDFFMKQSELFDNAVYIDEICDVICIALEELPSILNHIEVVEIFLHVQHGPRIICTIVANQPDVFREVCTALITNGEKQEEESLSNRIRMQTLSMLCQMNPLQALSIRSKCVELCRMPALAIMLTLGRSMEHLEDADNMEIDDSEMPDDSDIVAFVSGLLLGNDQQIRNWFALFVRNGQKRKWESHAALQLLRRALLKRLENINRLAIAGGNVADTLVVQASSLLRLYCALRGIAGIKFHDEEVNALIQLLTWHPSPSTAGVRFVSMGLCMLIACPTLISLPEHERKAMEWLQWLVHEEAYFKKASGVTASFGEMLLLMAIHFHSNQLSAIIDLVCSTLGMKVLSRSNNMSKIKHLFTQDVFTEQVVTSHAVKVPVTPNLNANMQGFLPVHCIHQLLKSRAFTKHKVPIKEWIYSQLICSEPPLHPVLPPLVEVYVNSMLVPSAKAPFEAVNQPITEDEIRSVFQKSFFGEMFEINNKHAVKSTLPNGKSPSLTAQLLLLYYLVLYEDVRLSNTHAHAQAGVSPRSYSTEFLAKLPIKHLLQQAQRDQHSYAGLFSPLLRLLATHFPHLSLVDDWLDEEPALDSVHNQRGSMELSSTIVDIAFNNLSNDPAHLARVLRRLTVLPATDVWPFADTLINHFATMLGDSVPRYIQELYRKVWLRLNSVLPRCLWVMTIKGLVKASDPIQQKALCLTQENLMQDPLQVLRCDVRVFRCAALLAIVLRVLQASLAASRSQLARHILDKPLIPGKTGQLSTESEREELKTALIATQESIAVQVLVEACLPTSNDKEVPGQLWSLREVSSVVCSHLHQVFISDPSLAKLVHFQGYSRPLLEVTVPGIPSMHICLDFIPELLSQPDLQKQLFAVDLVSHLAVQYALPKSLSVARLAVNTLSTLLAVLPNNSRVKLYGRALPALVRICRAFPPLIEDVVSLLMQLGRVCMAVASLDTGSTGSAMRYQSVADCAKYEQSIKLSHQLLCLNVQQAFSEILERAVLSTNVY
ncbi:integrator complex subunit 2 [Frankliniella occidentalis]|uniref:Integrator complex subunit 2 n=1 Tax=Frankliniella occidentalis TaxID=133901 RepID=A0A6J1T2J7_FRAOC|nr:integrator complex subunit 2 [Frankliniella occidentalis]